MNLPFRLGLAIINMMCSSPQLDFGFHGNARGESGIRGSQAFCGSSPRTAFMSRLFSRSYISLRIPPAIERGVSVSAIMVSLRQISTRRASEDMYEKDAAVMHLEEQPHSGISPEDREFLDNFTHEAKLKLLKKVIPTNNDHQLTATERIR